MAGADVEFAVELRLHGGDGGFPALIADPATASWPWGEPRFARVFHAIERPHTQMKRRSKMIVWNLLMPS